MGAGGPIAFLIIALAVSAGTGLLAHSSAPRAQVVVSFQTPDGELVHADVYGAGDRAVVLVGHGGYSSRVTWELPARTLAGAGFRVMAFDTRAAVALGGGKETDCLYDAACMAIDVLAAVRHVRGIGVRMVSVVGGSAGGGAAGQASIQSAAGEIDRLVLLAPMAIDAPEKMKGRKLFITSRDDRGANDTPRLPGIRAQYDRTPGPKRLVILDGAAHGQRMFGTPQEGQLMREMLRFLRER